MKIRFNYGVRRRPIFNLLTSRLKGFRVKKKKTELLCKKFGFSYVRFLKLGFPNWYSC